MAITIDRLTNIISVPQANWTFVSGTFYTHDTEQFRQDLKSIEASEEGMPFSDTNIRNAPVTVAGTTLAQSIQIISPYTVEYEDGAFSVQLTGSNNNIWSVGDGILVQNQTQVIPTNSAGLVIVTSGSGITEQDKDDIRDKVWNATKSSYTTNGTMGNYIATKLITVAKFLGLS